VLTSGPDLWQVLRLCAPTLQVLEVVDEEAPGGGRLGGERGREVFQALCGCRELEAVMLPLAVFDNGPAEPGTSFPRMTSLKVRG
jgi:hypothetical protein